jgi:exopolysaccharide production protein ExoZ
MIFFQVLLAPINIEFVAGVLAAHVFMRGPRMKGIACFGVAFTLILSFVLMGSNRHDSLLIGLAMATLLPWLCHQEMQGRFTVPNWLIFGGAASYAIYLVHNPLFSLSSRLMGAVGLDWMSALVLSFCTATGAGFAYYLAWERTIMQWAGKKVSKPKSLGKT